MKVLARIKLRSTADGGRKDPLVGPFRLNHSFQPGKFVIAQVQQRDGESLAPGQSANLIVDFLPETAPTLAKGIEWQICDGPTYVVGHGMVLEVFKD